MTGLTDIIFGTSLTVLGLFWTAKGIKKYQQIPPAQQSIEISKPKKTPQNPQKEIPKTQQITENPNYTDVKCIIFLS